jgi:hypothetical protein
MNQKTKPPHKDMKQLLKAEEAALLILCFYLLYIWQSPWWCYVLLVAGPDISMLGYLINNRTGALTYNLFHHKAIAVGFAVAGWLVPCHALLLTGIILFGHSTMDRMFGYGLKLKEGFSFKHLGTICKKNL